MGVDHGGWRNKSPRIGVGDANANCPPQILSHKNERYVAFKIRQNPLGELTTLLHALKSAGEGTSLSMPHPTPHRPTLGARHASPRIPARSTPAPCTCCPTCMIHSNATTARRGVHQFRKRYFQASDVLCVWCTADDRLSGPQSAKLRRLISALLTAGCNYPVDADGTTSELTT